MKCELQSVIADRHFETAMQSTTRDYRRSVAFRIAMLSIVALLLPITFCVSLAVGAASVPIGEILKILCGFESEPRLVRIIVDIRLPQALAAMLAGAGLAISGATMQGVLRNPLCSPYILGISSAAAFGAAVVLFLGGTDAISRSGALAGYGGTIVALGAFGCSTLTALTILMLGRLRGTRSETIILIGVALNSLFMAGLTFLQYMADDVRLAAIVHWTFGDTARATWNSLTLLTVCTFPITVYFLCQSWNYNALIFGEETARGLGVPVRRLRFTTMLLSSLLTAVFVSTLGIIGFVGLVVPHVARLVVGSDYRFLLPFSLLFGALLLLIADTAARLILAPRVLPVAILTAFIGVPVFLSLLLGKRGM